jgi:hypothetical protein
VRPSGLSRTEATPSGALTVKERTPWSHVGLLPIELKTGGRPRFRVFGFSLYRTGVRFLLVDFCHDSPGFGSCCVEVFDHSSGKPPHIALDLFRCTLQHIDYPAKLRYQASIPH